MKDLYQDVLKLVAQSAYEGRDVREVTKDIMKVIDVEIVLPTIKLMSEAHDKTFEKK